MKIYSVKLTHKEKHCSLVIRQCLYDLFLQPLKLKPIVSGIDIVFVDQLLVSAAFFDAVFPDHDDLISIADGGQTVGDGDAGPAFSEKTHPHDNKTV